MTEGYYQNKIIKAIEAIGGQVVNGQYTKTGEADLQCGYPIEGKLLYIAIEVKTKKDYSRVMSGLALVDNRYIVTNRAKLKEHEPMQVIKINRVRNRGGMALIAYNFKQVQEYIKTLS